MTTPKALFKSLNYKQLSYATHHEKKMNTVLSPPGGGRDVSTYYVTTTCHFARKIGTHSSANSGGF